MWQLRYYNSVKDLKAENLNFQIVANYENPQLAYGMRKKTSKKPEYNINLLKVVKL
jgi:hypothetical protein